MYVTRSMTEIADMSRGISLYGKEKAVDLTGDYFGVYVECNGKVYARRMIKVIKRKDSADFFCIACAVDMGFLNQLIYHRLDVKNNY